MTFWLYMTLCTTSGSLRLPRYIILRDSRAHNGDVENMTHDITRHDSAGIFVLLVCMSSFSAIGWWMSSWFITASPLHGKVHGVLDGPWFAWCFFWTLLLSCMLECLTGSSVCERCMFVCSSIYEHILHVHSYVHSWAHLRMIVSSRAYIFTCIICSSVGEPVLLHVLLFIHLVRCHPMFVCAPVLAVTHDKTTSNLKTS